jgi:aryl-alcohol dehydrogenase-like predicted oxidoreductase
MQSLNDVVRAGKVLYLGISDTPAWIVAKANQYARDHGLRQFSVYQGEWNAAQRDIERDVLPMTIDEGMGIAPWGPVGAGRFKTEAQRAKQAAENQGRGLQEQPESVKAIVKALDGIAKKKGTILTSVALAYILQKTPYCFPLVGGRNIDHLKGNIEALSLELSEEDVEEIENAGSFEFGWPHSMIGRAADQSSLNAIGGVFDVVQPPKAIRPRKL